MADVDVLLTIGEFSKMTYLSVKALRHYHDVGLLEPALVDDSTGYRRYSSGQVPVAQAIRRVRDLDMPIDDVRKVLHAGDEAARNRTILAHLERMQAQLDQTQQAVASLQTLLRGEAARAGTVEIRRFPALRVLATAGRVGLAECGQWLEPVFASLHETAAATSHAVVGDSGALYEDDIFELVEGTVTAFVPVEGDQPSVVLLPACTMAVLRHEGPFTELDQTYGALGTFVAERGISGPGPIREIYLDETSTDVCWPITTGATS
jgi:DNA-binding transcriptional MerR regulator/effector-binding domain-containing protein